MPKKYNCVINGTTPRYRVRAKVGTALDGKPIYKSFYGDGKVEAERKRDEYLRQRSTTNKTLGQLAEYYTYNIFVNENVSPTTVELYERQYRVRLKTDRIATLQVSDITTADLQRFMNSQQGSQSAITALAKYLVHLFTWLNSQGYCDNLMTGVTTPKHAPEPAKDIAVFTDGEIQAVISTPNRLQLLFVLALATGLRRGELLGLQYKDIQDGTLTVNKQLSEHYRITSDGYREYVQTIKPPKSKSSTRTLPLPENVLPVLERHRTWHKQEQERNGYTTDYIFTTNTGRFISKGSFQHAWKLHLNKAGVQYKKFHACRSTYCTLLCKNGVPLETAAKLMGHSDVTVTAKFYRLVSSEELTSAVARINAVFKPSGD